MKDMLNRVIRKVDGDEVKHSVACIILYILLIAAYVATTIVAFIEKLYVGIFGVICLIIILISILILLLQKLFGYR